MMRSLWTAASGMIAQQTNVDTIANNLANVNTVGYKTQVNEFKSLLYQNIQTRTTSSDGTPKPTSAQVGLGVRNAALDSIFTQGNITATESDTAFAIEGDGFFALRGNDGTTQYTRNGNFLLGKEGILETKDGYPLMGENGAIHVEDDKFTVNEDGMIYSKDGELIDRIKVVRFDNERYLKKMGNSLWSSNDISGEAYVAEGLERPKMMQGYMETSNVNVVNEMVKMIEVNRAYEASQKTIQSEDSMMSTLWTKVAAYR